MGVAEIVIALLLVIPYMIRAIVLTFVPVSWRAKSVEGDIVLVTGGGSGIGRLLCLKFSDLGSRIITWDVNEAGNKETARLVRQAGGECHTYTVDLCKRQDIYRVAAQVKKDVGKVDILINNAGIVTGKNFMEAPDEEIQRTMDVNTLAHFWTTKAFLGDMINSNKGHLVTIASLAGLNGMQKLADYCASKFGAVGFDESIRMELYNNNISGVHTTVICPFYIKTGMFDGVVSNIVPLLEPDYAAQSIVDGILCNTDQVILPSYGRLVGTLKSFLPSKSYMMICHAAEISTGMDHFTGRKKIN